MLDELHALELTVLSVVGVWVTYTTGEWVCRRSRIAWRRFRRHYAGRLAGLLASLLRVAASEVSEIDRDAAGCVAAPPAHPAEVVAEEFCGTTRLRLVRK